MWYKCAKDAYELHISLWHSNLIWIVTYSWFMPWLCGFGRALLEETITRKLQSVYLDFFFKILLFHVAYILFYRFFLLTLSGWVVIAVCDSVSVQGTSWVLEELLTNAELPLQWQVNLMSAITFLCLFLIFFLTVNYGLQIVCYLCEGR